MTQPCAAQKRHSGTLYTCVREAGHGCPHRSAEGIDSCQWWGKRDAEEEAERKAAG